MVWERFRDAGPARAPERRSLMLLRSWLSADQREQFDARGYFDVVGSHTRRRYRIRFGTSTNIHELDSFEQSVAGWCFVPTECLPAGDVMLAQKIALENDEPSALAVAKSFRAQFAIG
ncbi:MAG: hypothetical protein C5B56_05955 [Proteobacteria bacterium]|nr:MAG: hypothetical protein C5B56_05955 [Pseudomonadota bacterium]